MSWMRRGREEPRRGGSRRREQPTVDEAKVNEIFDQFKSEDDADAIDIEGLGALGEAIGVDATEDLSILVLAWIAEAKQPMAIARDEFLSAMARLRCEDLASLRLLLQEMDPRALDHAGYRSFYRFVFMFQREGRRRTIETELVGEMLKQVLTGPHVTQFLAFLDVCKEPVITIDQWNSFYEFQHKIELDMSNFDDNDAWPVLLDEYAGWVQEGCKGLEDGGKQDG